MKKYMILIAGVILLFGAAAFAQDTISPMQDSPVMSTAAPSAAPTAPGDVTAKINLIMDDGTIIFYAGAKQGVKVGDEFTVYRKDQQIGTLKVVRIGDLASYCKVTSGDAKEMDTVVRTKTAAAPTKPKAVKEEPAPPPKEIKKPPETKKEEKKAQVEPKPLPEKKPEPPKMKRPEPGPVPVTFYGTGGLIYMPTATVTPQGGGAINFHYVNATDKMLEYRDTGFGVTYGVSQDIEAAFARVQTKSTTSGTTDSSINTSVFSLKYLARHSNNKPDKRNVQQGNLDYAVGFTYFNMGSGNVTGAGSTSVKATRLYLVGSGEYSGARIHIGVYTQNGNLLKDSGYSGFGFNAGAEYPLGNFAGGLSLIGEYDHKAYYLDTGRTPSVGLRYTSGPIAATLAFLDVTKTKILSFGGSYSF